MYNLNSITFKQEIRGNIITIFDEFLNISKRAGRVIIFMMGNMVCQ